MKNKIPFSSPKFPCPKFPCPVLPRSLPAGASQSFATTRHGFGRPGGTTENSPALECWVRGDATRKSRRDDRVIGSWVGRTCRDLVLPPSLTQH